MTDPVETVAQAVSMPSSTRPFWISQTIMAPTTAPINAPAVTAVRSSARWIAATLKGEKHDCRDSDNKPHQRHDHDPITIDPDTGIVRSLAIAPDGLDAAAECSVVE